MTAPYFVTPGAHGDTFRIHGPGLGYDEETGARIVFEGGDKTHIDMICAALCIAHRAGERSNQDAIKRLLGFQP